MADVDQSDQARQEIKDMIDATLSVVGRAYDVDQTFVITEIKNYLKVLADDPNRKPWLRLIKYTPKTTRRNYSIH